MGTVASVPNQRVYEGFRQLLCRHRLLLLVNAQQPTSTRATRQAVFEVIPRVTTRATPSTTLVNLVPLSVGVMVVPEYEAQTVERCRATYSELVTKEQHRYHSLTSRLCRYAQPVQVWVAYLIHGCFVGYWCTFRVFFGFCRRCCRVFLVDGVIYFRRFLHWTWYWFYRMKVSISTI